jgi:hypothetical protein
VSSKPGSEFLKEDVRQAVTLWLVLEGRDFKTKSKEEKNSNTWKLTQDEQSCSLSWNSEIHI